MRIAYVSADPGVPVFGCKGCSVHVQEVARAFLRQGASIDLIAANVGGEVPDTLRRVTLRQLSPTEHSDPAIRELLAVHRNEELRRLLVSTGPFDLIYERYSLWSFAGMQYAQAAGIPGLLEVNAPLIDEQARHRALVDRAAAEQVAALAFDAATAIIAVSQEVADCVAACSRRTGGIHVIPNGVDVARFRPDVRPCWPDSDSDAAFTVGFVGTLKPWHDVAAVVDAVAALHSRRSRVRMLVVGDGPGADSLRRTALARGVSHALHMTGAVDPQTVPSWLTSMTIGVAPYVPGSEFYFSPLKIFEYMAAGLPVVASGVGQVLDIVQDGVTGVLCPPGDGPALTAAIDKLHDDPLLRRTMAVAARTAAVQGHSWDGVCRQLLHIAGQGGGTPNRAAWT